MPVVVELSPLTPYAYCTVAATFRQESSIATAIAVVRSIRAHRLVCTLGAQFFPLRALFSNKLGNRNAIAAAELRSEI